MLDAIVAHAGGAVALAEADAPSALASLRHACVGNLVYGEDPVPAS